MPSWRMKIESEQHALKMGSVDIMLVAENWFPDA